MRNWRRGLRTTGGWILAGVIVLGACGDDDASVETGDASGAGAEDAGESNEPTVDVVHEELDGSSVAGLVELGGDPVVVSSGGDAVRLDGEDWELADTEGLGEETSGVAGDGSSAIAVTDGEVVRSEDDLRWEPVAATGLEGAQVNALTSGPDGYVAFGSDESDEHGIWTSPDGVAWEALDLSGLPSDDEEVSYSIADLAVSADQWLLVLADFGYDDGGYSLYGSSDGRSWAEIEDDLHEVFECPNCEAIPSIAAADGRFYAFGGADHFELLESPDGVAWEGDEVDDAGLPEQSSVDDLEAIPSGLVAAYADEDDPIIVWRFPSS